MAEFQEQEKVEEDLDDARVLPGQLQIALQIL